MRVYSKGFETKRLMVLITYNKLKNQKASTLTVRDLAKEGGFSSAAMYRYFDSLEELISVASVKFLEEYMTDYGKIMDNEHSFLETYIEGWRLFNRHAFSRPDIYYGLFWGKYHDDFGNAMGDYYELFPFMGSEKYPAYFYTLFFNDNMYERDFQMLRRVCNANLMSEEDALYLSRSNPLIVKGILSENLDSDEGQCRKAEKECNKLLDQNMERIFLRQKMKDGGEFR